MALVATTAITGAIAAARLWRAAGWLTVLPSPAVMSAAHALALAGTIILTLWPAPADRGPGPRDDRPRRRLCLPPHRRRHLRLLAPADYGRIAGRIYIAWCVAAVSLPVLAGHLYDLSRGYGVAVIIAAGANVAGIALALTMPRHGWRERG